MEIREQRRGWGKGAGWHRSHMGRPASTTQHSRHIKSYTQHCKLHWGQLMMMMMMMWLQGPIYHIP